MKKAITKLTVAALLFGLGYTVSVSTTEPATSESTVATKSYGKVEHPATDFDNQIASGIVILDFFATWCPPCQRFSSVFTNAAEKHPNILFIKIDVEKYQDIANRFGIRSMPTIIALKDGKKIKTKTGFMNKAQFDTWINSLA